MSNSIKSITAMALALGTISLVSASPIEFYYLGNVYGSMNLSVSNASTVQVQFTAAASVPGVTDFQVTGFAFELTPDITLGISNPTAGAFAGDQDALNWIKLTNMSAIPTAENSGVKKSVWDLGVTEGSATSFNPPGVHPGQMDIFCLTGFTGLTAGTDLTSVITLEGIRLQAIEPGGSSLFLTGGGGIDPVVPEPSSMLLLGLGLLGSVVLAAKRKIKA